MEASATMFNIFSNFLNYEKLSDIPFLFSFIIVTYSEGFRQTIVGHVLFQHGNLIFVKCRFLLTGNAGVSWAVDYSVCVDIDKRRQKITLVAVMNSPAILRRRISPNCDTLKSVGRCKKAGVSNCKCRYFLLYLIDLHHVMLVLFSCNFSKTLIGRCEVEMGNIVLYCHGCIVQ